MGEMADLYDYLIDDDEDYAFDPRRYFDNGPEWLVENTKQARKPIVVSIRKQWMELKVITEKQQWVLAYWCASSDRKHS